MLKGKKVLLITASHLSSCPRLLKEATLLSENSCEIHIVYLNSLKMLEHADDQIRNQHPTWNFYPIYWKGTKSNFAEVMASKSIYKICKLLHLSTDLIQSTSRILINKVLSIKADLYIAHHPSVLVAAAKASILYNAKFIYDIEDAFPFVEEGRFESNPNPEILSIENKFIRDASLLTCASPLYAEVYQKLYKLQNQPLTVLNVFDVHEEPIVDYKDRKDLYKISFYWFSQTVGLNRGLQDLCKALNELDANKWELHIRGNCEASVKSELLRLITDESKKAQVFFHEPLDTAQLVLRNKEHDIGFALEGKSTLNRNLCISNKMLDYIASGLMVIATNTEGHKYILNQLDAKELAYEPGDVGALKKLLTTFINDKSIIQRYKEKSLQIAKDKFNWKTHSENWLVEIKKIMA
jgi:glycosyltransferase involved in cell wall biosynthesis